MMLPGNPVDCFLAGIMNTLSSYGLSLGSSTTNMFYVSSGVTATDVLRLNIYMKMKKLDPRGLMLGWFVSLVEFIESGDLVGGNDSSYLLSSKFFSYDTSYVKDHLSQVGSDVIPVYTNSLVRDFDSSGASGDAATYFPNADMGVGVRVPGLLSSTLAEMQTITLVLDCIPNHSSVVLFTDSQASLDLCATILVSTKPDFRRKCWMECHTSIIGNKCANFFAGAVTGSSFIFPVKTLHHFLSVEGRTLSGNACHMTRRLYEAVNLVGWKSRYVSDMVDESFSDLIDKHHTFNMWHMDGQIKSSYTISASVMLSLYFVKALHHQLPVVKRKKLYNLSYLNVLCIHYGLLEDSDHIFVCVFNVNTRNDLILEAIKDWTILVGAHVICSVVVCLLHKAMDSNSLYMSLFKGFMFKDWVAKTKWFLEIESNSGSLVVDLVHHFAKNHRSSIWLLRAKLRAYYKKHGLLLHNGSIVLLVTGLFSVWFCSMVYNFGIKLDIHTCFGLYPHLNSVQFGFLCDFSVAGIFGM
ncbi:hypothetical protein G9A89_017483 [Geosiphon pyriformis]|nr:hypothetical protein G9A89_017483 [Geosiphon pyriformis]